MNVLFPAPVLPIRMKTEIGAAVGGSPNISQKVSSPCGKGDEQTPAGVSRQKGELPGLDSVSDISRAELARVFNSIFEIRVLRLWCLFDGSVLGFFLQ